MLEAIIQYLSQAGFGIDVKRSTNEVPIWVAAKNKGRLLLVVFPVAGGRCLAWTTPINSGSYDVPEESSEENALAVVMEAVRAALET